MSSTIETLRRMADDIAKNFDAMAHENSALATADHIKAFWDPRMRREILSYADEQRGAGLKKIVLEALRNHRIEIGGKEPNSRPSKP